MYAATPVIAAVMGAATLASLYTLWKLRLAAASPSTRMARLVVSVLVLTALLFFASYGGTASPWMDFLAIAPQAMSLWAAAFLLHLILLMRQNDGRGLSYLKIAIIWAPASAMTFLVAAEPAVFPGTYMYGCMADFYNIHFGWVGPVVAAVATGYLVASLAALAFMIRSGGAGNRRELAVIFTIMALTFSDVVNAIMHITGVPKTAIPLIFQSLTGIALAYAVMWECPLIVPQTEPGAAPGPSRPVFTPGSMHLCLHRSRGAARAVFASMVRNGAQGLWVTRQSPGQGRAGLGLVNTPAIWLTGTPVEGETCVGPAETARLSKAVIDFLGAAHDSVILFEGLEYIVSNLGFKGGLNLLQFINDKVMSSKGVILVSVDPDAFRSDELALLRSEATESHEEGDGACKSGMQMVGPPAPAGPGWPGAMEPAGAGRQ